MLAACPSNSSSDRLIIQIETNKFLSYWTTDGSTGIIKHAGTNVLAEDMNYYIKLVNFNGSYTALISTDGENYTTDCTFTSSYSIATNYVLFGYSNESNLFLRGSIDLNNTYIKVNDCLLFYGKNYATSNMVPVPVGLEYNNTTTPSIGWVDTDTSSSNFQQFTSAPEGTMIGKDDTHSLAVETYQDKGIIDYTIVGNPSIMDGVVSGFSGSNYLRTSLPFNPHSNNWELVCSFIYQPSAGLFGSTTGYDYQGITLVFNNNKLRWCLSSTGLSWDIVGARIVGESLQNGVKYKVKISYNGTQYNLFLSTENSDYILIDSQISSTPIFGSSSGIGFGNNYIGSNQFFNGSIDLKSTYIVINGQYWFHPYPNSFPKLVGPVNYEIIGNPTVENGIVSSFSEDDHIQLNNSQVSNVYSFDSCIKIKFSSEAIGGWFYYFGCFALSKYYDGGTLEFLYRNTTDSWQAIRGAGTQTNIANTWIWIKSGCQNGTAYLSYSFDGKSYATVGTNQYNLSTGLIDANSTLGKPDGGRDLGKGSIDLNETYIKINDTLWFGKENWTPSTYTDNSIYLLAGHKTDYSSYNELDFTPTITNNDTYNVTIDNQEVFTNMSSGTHIEWNKLNLTTGYSITTPSALKAHTIKISPSDNTKHIIGYTCDYDESN